MPASIADNKPFLKPLSLEKSDLLALFICLGIFSFWLNLLFKKFTYFGYYDWDLAMYAQATWALSHGSMHASLFGTNFLTNHAEYIAFFLAPIYRMFPSALTLIVFKIISFVGGSFVFYLIAKKLLGWRIGMIFMLLYQLHPANAFMMIYEFHFENLAIIFIFLMYYSMQNRQFIPFLISAGFATLVKENISLVVFMFGLFALIKQKPNEKKWVIGPLILGLGFFILTMFIITPYLRMHEGINSANQYIGMYWHHQDKAVPLTKILQQNFVTLLDTFLSPVNKHYIAQLFLPFNILPFLSPFTLLLGAPIFLQHFFSPSFTNHSLYYHYAATAVIFIFLASVQSLKWIKNKIRPICYYLFIITIIAGYVSYLGKFSTGFIKSTALWQDRLDPVRQQMLDQIPQNAATVASFDFLAQLTERKEIFSLHNVWQNYAPFTGKSPFILPENLSYALIDWNCPWLWHDLLNPNPDIVKSYLARINNFYFSRQWNTISAVEEITLLSTTKTAQMPLVENSRIPFHEIAQNKNVINVENTIKLLNLTIDPPQNSKNKLLPLEFIWQSHKKTDDFLTIDIRILKDGKIIVQREHPIGYTFNATPFWEEGEYVKERYNILLPSSMTSGKYTLNIAIYDRNTQNFKLLFINEQEFSAFALPLIFNDKTSLE